MADKLSLRFRIGPQMSGTTKRAEDATAEVVQVLRKMIKEKGVEDLAAAIVIGQESIIREIRLDADRFARNAASVMTRVRSPATGSIYVSVDDVNRNFVGSTSFEQFKEGNRLVEGSHTVVSWNALTARTLANKRYRSRKMGPRGGSDTFFVDSGELRSVLTTYLGPAFAALVDPQIIVNDYPEKGKVTVTLITMAKNIGFAKKFVGRENLPFLNTGSSGNAASSGNETVLVQYLRSAGARDPDLGAKLTNPRGTQRPFLQPVLAFWLTTRLPIVLERCLLRVLKSKKFTNRTTNKVT
jgi:hypothetical protein